MLVRAFKIFDCEEPHQSWWGSSLLFGIVHPLLISHCLCSSRMYCTSATKTGRLGLAKFEVVCCSREISNQSGTIYVHAMTGPIRYCLPCSKRPPTKHPNSRNLKSE